MNFKPTKWKAIIFIGIIVVSYILGFYLLNCPKYKCLPLELRESCTEVSVYLQDFIPHCPNCECYSYPRL